jgi:hypothetical protein
MRLGALVSVAILVLVTLVDAFPQVQADRASGSNVSDHMGFNRELADHAAKLDTLRTQQASLEDMPVRMARIEERLAIMSSMIYSLLVGVFGLLAKEVWGAVQMLRSRLGSAGAGKSG